MIEIVHCQPYNMYKTDEQIKSRHTAAEAWWVWGITCCQDGRLPVCWYMFCAAQSAQCCLKIPDTFEWVKQTHKQKQSLCFSTGMGQSLDICCEAYGELVPVEKKVWLFILVSALLVMMTRHVLHRALRAGWASGSESNYREQCDPVGMATLMIPFQKTEVLPCRYVNYGTGVF